MLKFNKLLGTAFLNEKVPHLDTKANKYTIILKCSSLKISPIRVLNFKITFSWIYWKITIDKTYSGCFKTVKPKITINVILLK